LLLDAQKITALSSYGLDSRQHWIKLGKGSFGTVIQAKYKGRSSSKFRQKVIVLIASEPFSTEGFKINKPTLKIFFVFI
jgi:hypothetical protein